MPIVLQCCQKGWAKSSHTRAAEAELRCSTASGNEVFRTIGRFKTVHVTKLSVLCDEAVASSAQCAAKRWVPQITSIAGQAGPAESEFQKLAPPRNMVSVAPMLA